MSHLPTPQQLDDWLLTAREAAEEAAAVHSEWAGRIGVSDAAFKRFADMVSEADLLAQEAAFAVIRRRHPDHLFLAEEGRASETDLPEDATPIWIVDPLDGTANFLHGHPMFASSVAVASSGRVAAGAVTASALKQRWWARRGGGAFRDGRRVATSARDSLEGAMVATGFPFKNQEHVGIYGPQLGRVLSAGAQVRRGGAAAIDLCYVADGRFEAFWEAELHPWDYAAGQLILEEAGGACGRLEGGSLDLLSGSVAAANSAEMLDTIRTRVNGEGIPV